MDSQIATCLANGHALEDLSYRKLSLVSAISPGYTNGDLTTTFNRGIIRPTI